MDASSSNITREVCRTCLKQITSGSTFSLDALEPNIEQPIMIRQKLSTCAPELNLNIVPNAVICGDCLTAIDFAYRFKNQCLQAERLLGNYISSTFSTSDFIEYVHAQHPAQSSDLAVTNPEGIKVEPLGIFSESIAHEQESCGDGFLEKSGNLNVQRIENRVSSYQCYNCKHIFETKFELTDHVKGCCDQDRQKYINRRRPTSAVYKVSHRRCPQDKPFKCTHCAYSSNQINNLKRHLTRHTGDAPHKCHVCGYCAAFRSIITNHMKIHTGEKKYQCPECNYRCAYKQNLNVHRKIHIREKLRMQTNDNELKYLSENLHRREDIQIATKEAVPNINYQIM